MSNQLPDDILDIIGGLTPEQEKQVVGLWQQHEKYIGEYSDKYIGQRVNLVQGNRAFGEMKTIPTPQKEAERLHSELLERARAFAKENEEEMQKGNESTGQEHGQQVAVNDNGAVEMRNGKMEEFMGNQPQVNHPNSLTENEQQEIYDETLRQLRENKVMKNGKGWGR